MDTAGRYRAILANHVPPAAVDWVYDYLDRHRVHLHFTRERRTKLGDYRWPQPHHGFHEISVNDDLRKEMSLWVLMHEMAHLETHLKYRSVAPHGHEWQTEYARLLMPHAAEFGPEAQPLVQRYALRVPLNRALGRKIECLLRGDDGSLTLNALHEGARFRLANRPEKLFVANEKRRTRWLCTDVGSGRQYLVVGAAKVVLDEFVE